MTVAQQILENIDDSFLNNVKNLSFISHDNIPKNF